MVNDKLLRTIQLFRDKIFGEWNLFFLNLFFTKGKILADKICEGVNGNNTMNILY